MDHAETVAKNVIETALPGAKMQYRNNQSRGQHDFDLFHPDGRVSALEVTSFVDRETQETHAAILDKKKRGSFVDTALCRKDWYVHPLMGANINKIRANIDRYLADVESAGIERFWARTDAHPAVERIYLDLGILSSSVFPHWKEPGCIGISLPGGGGAVGASLATGAAIREAGKSDNRRKLQASGTSERHLAVYVDVMTMAWCALVDFEPPLESPQLPHEVTDIWLYSETRSVDEYVVWRAGTSTRWRAFRLIVPHERVQRADISVAKRVLKKAGKGKPPLPGDEIQ